MSQVFPVIKNRMRDILEGFRVSVLAGVGLTAKLC